MEFRYARALAAMVLLYGSVALGQDAFLSNMGMPRYAKANTNYNVSVHVQNNSAIHVMSYHVDWRLNGGTVHTGATVNVGGSGLQNGGYYIAYTSPVPLNVATAGPQVLKVWVISPGDTDHSNDTLTVDFTTLTTWAAKVVLLEDRTETWCPQCPPANTLTNTLMDDPDYAVAKFHLSDALNDCPECITYYNQHNINYVPAGIIEMGEYGSYAITSNYNTWSDDMAQRALGVSPVQLTLSSSVNWTTRQLSATISAQFNYGAITGPFNLNVYVLENDVPGPQDNAPANYIHHNVMRAMLGGVGGTGGVVPDNPIVGTSYSHAYTYTVPAGFKIGDLRLIGVLEHSPGGFNDRYCLNAVKSAASPVGIAELTMTNAVTVYPDPFTDELWVKADGITGTAGVSLIACDGRVVATDRVQIQEGQAFRFDLGAASLAPGPYVLRLTSDSGTVEKQVVNITR